MLPPDAGIVRCSTAFGRDYRDAKPIGEFCFLVLRQIPNAVAGSAGSGGIRVAPFCPRHIHSAPGFLF